MMKRCGGAMVALFLAGASVFAFDLSFGGGISLGGTFSSTETDKIKSSPLLPSTGLYDIAMQYKTGSFDFGAFAFADAQFVELQAGFVQQIGKVTDTKMKGSGTMAGTPGMPKEMKIDDEDYVNSLVMLDVLGKYPFALNKKLSLYPALGVSFRFPVAGNDYSDYGHDITWGMGAKAGGGCDFALTDKLFLRGELLYYFELAADHDFEAEQGGNKLKLHAKDHDPSQYYMGPQVKLAVGYKLPLSTKKAEKTDAPKE